MNTHGRYFRCWPRPFKVTICDLKDDHSSKFSWNAKSSGNLARLRLIENTRFDTVDRRSRDSAPRPGQRPTDGLFEKQEGEHVPARAAILAVGECGEPANPGGRKCKELQKRRCRGELECALRGTMLEGAIQRSIHAR